MAEPSSFAGLSASKALKLKIGLTESTSPGNLLEMPILRPHIRHGSEFAFEHDQVIVSHWISSGLSFCPAEGSSPETIVFGAPASAEPWLIGAYYPVLISKSTCDWLSPNGA